jgi:translation elongation factor EF-Ts
VTVSELIASKIAELGENMVIRRFTRYMVGEEIDAAPKSAEPEAAAE